MNHFLGMSVDEVARKFSVNIPGTLEMLWQPQYDTITYPAAGLTQAVFFQNPVGQAGRNKALTNVTTAGVFPSMQNFIATGIQYDFQPGVATTLPTYWDDVIAVYNSGWSEFNVGSKTFNQDAPIGKFPPQYRVDAVASVLAAGTAAYYAQARGAYYEITPALIPSNQNYNLTLQWPALVPTPSTLAGTIRATLDGYLIRAAQ